MKMTKKSKKFPKILSMVMYMWKKYHTFKIIYGM